MLQQEMDIVQPPRHSYSTAIIVAIWQIACYAFIIQTRRMPSTLYIECVQLMSIENYVLSNDHPTYVRCWSFETSKILPLI